MITDTKDISELARDEYTEFIYDDVFFGEPISSENAEALIDKINRAFELASRPVFCEGLAARLTQLGVTCCADDKELMLSEVKKRYKSVLGHSCPRTVQEWIKGTTPGITNPLNNYELCFALEMDYRETWVFFQKYYLTIPFNVKSRVGAVFMYGLYRKRSYEDIIKLLNGSDGFVSQENAHTSTMRIRQAILDIDDDSKFLRYLSEHCYNNEQQFMLARKIICDEIKTLREFILRYEPEPILSSERLGSCMIKYLLGYEYQKDRGRLKSSRLPKRFTESLPNDVTLGRIINGETVSYELLRKTLMLLKFHNFYFETGSCGRSEICGNLLDFYEELRNALFSCGFALPYLRHPFDCLLLHCANSEDPIDTLHNIINNDKN